MTGRHGACAPDDAVAAVMSTPPAEVDAGEPIRAVAQELAAGDIGAVVVRSGGVVVGLVSERDLVPVLAAGGDRETTQAADVMSTDLVAVAAADSVAAAGEAMLEAGIRHVLVRRGVDVVGVVSMRDVLAVLVRGSR